MLSRWINKPFSNRCFHHSSHFISISLLKITDQSYTCWDNQWGKVCVASLGIYSAGNQTNPSLIRPIDFGALSCGADKRYQSSVNHRSARPHGSFPAPLSPKPAQGPSHPPVTGLRGQTRDRRNPKISFHFHQGCQSSKVCHVNNQRISFNLWPSGFTRQDCHTDFSLHSSNPATPLPKHEEEEECKREF